MRNILLYSVAAKKIEKTGIHQNKTEEKEKSQTKQNKTEKTYKPEKSEAKQNITGNILSKNMQ